jgi:hypothetical protein
LGTPPKSCGLEASGAVTVYFREGTYYLDDTIVFTDADSGAANALITYASYTGEEAVISGGVPLQLKWEKWRGGIMKAHAPAGLRTGQLFANGECQTMARYPNFDAPAQYFNGTAPDAFSKERVAKWADPRGGFIHAMQREMWGDFHYLIAGKDANGNLIYEGGWQNNRQMGMHDKYRFVENIFEELDAPGEWYLDEKASTLYFYPPKGLNLGKATVEAVRLRQLIEFRGTARSPVRFITLKGLTFRHAARTFMENREPLLRSDWTIYRGGAIVFEGAEDCALEDSTVD